MCVYVTQREGEWRWEKLKSYTWYKYKISKKKKCCMRHKFLNHRVLCQGWHTLRNECASCNIYYHILSCLPGCPFWGFQLGMHDRDFSWLNTLIPILQTQPDACVCMTYTRPSATHWLLGTGAMQADRARQSWVWILSLHLKYFLPWASHFTFLSLYFPTYETDN